ncbi:MAG: hypothetical protein GQ550_07425 [Gammaproteobacteria bacterium]|nr:hypothetical protein [Gammaproteobacteria bacterium]
MNSYLAFKKTGIVVANLRNSQLLRAICALMVNILQRNLLHSGPISDSLA